MTQKADKDLGPHPDFPDSRVRFDENLGFYRTFPYPSEETLEHFYTQEYRAIRQEAPDADYLRFMRYRATEQSKFILEASSRRNFQSVIDIGCGCGELLNALQPHAQRLHGFETDAVMAAHAKAHRLGHSIEIHNEHYSPAKHLIKSDLITMSHVLEHIPEPVEFLANIRKHSLSSGGVLFLEVPNEPEYWVANQIHWQRRGLGHINYFTHKSLDSLLIEAGFVNTVARQCGQLVRKHMSAARPRTSIFDRACHKIRRLFPTSQTLPAYEILGGPEERVYLQVIAFNAIQYPTQ